MVEDGVVTDKVVHLDANQEEDMVIAQANSEIDEVEQAPRLAVECRTPTASWCSPRRRTWT